MEYELFHLAISVVFMVFGTIGSAYALNTIRVLYKSPEMLKTQKELWLPLLIGTVLFTVGGVFHFGEHAFYEDPIMDVLNDGIIAIGFIVFTVSVLQYARDQAKYYKLKQMAKN